MFSKMRLCIIGGGLTGAVAAAGVRQRLPQAHIEILDKGRIFGEFFVLMIT